MSGQLRVLIISPKECLPANTGARLRNYHLARELSRYAQVTFLAFSEDVRAKETDLIDSPSSPLWGPRRVITVPRAKGYTPGKLLRGAVGQTPLTVLNYTTRIMTQTLERLLAEEQFDVVQIESLLLSQYLPILLGARSRPLLVCDWHNIDSEVMRRYSEIISNPVLKLYARWTARQLESLEKRLINQFAAHFTVSERDQQKLLTFGAKTTTIVAENGVDTDFYSASSCAAAHAGWLSQNKARESGKQRVLFVGSMDYHANAEAVVSFAHEVWSDIYRANSDLVFTIVGRNPSEAVRKLSDFPGIEITGTVSDVRPYYHEAIASIVPLRTGGGSRLKILESMAAGVPVVSTTLGAEGLDVSDKENILLADSKAEFCRSLHDLSSNDCLNLDLADAGLKLVRAKYDWQMIGHKVFEMFESLTLRSRAINATLNHLVASVGGGKA